MQINFLHFSDKYLYWQNFMITSLQTSMSAAADCFEKRQNLPTSNYGCR
jgi:hypothetical protein